MKVMVFVKATKKSEAGVLPSTELIEAMGRFNEQLADAGILVEGDGLKPSSQGKRIRFVGDEREVIDGPFPATRELVSGFWIWNVRSMDEAMEWAMRCPHPMPGEDAELEIRPFYEEADFGAEFTPELREREARLRARLEGQQAP